MAKEQLGIGIIGPGIIGRIHIDAVRRLPEASLVAVAASSAEKAETVARELRIPHAYGDYRRLLDNDAVQVVHICTRNRTHHDIVKHAIEAGKHIVCEKPLATNSTETGKMLELAAASGKVDAVCYNSRFHPLMQHLRAMIRAGELGTVHSVHGSYLQDWLLLDSVYNWRLNPAESGPSSTLFDIGTHWLDLVRFLTGLQATAVSADLGTVVPERTTSSVAGGEGPSAAKRVAITSEDYAAVLIDFEGRARGSLVACQVAPGRKNRLSVEVNGTKASAAWNSERPNELWMGYRTQRNDLMLCEGSLLDPAARATLPMGGGHTFGMLDSHFHLLKAVYKEILGEAGAAGEPGPTFARFSDGHKDVLTVEAMLASHRRRGWVSVAL